MHWAVFPGSVGHYGGQVRTCFWTNSALPHCYMKSCVSSQLPEFPQPPSNLWTPLVKSSHKPLSERATCHKKCSHHKLSQKMFPSTSDVTSYHVTLSHLGKGACQLKFLRKDQQDGLMTECDPGSRKWTLDLDGSVALHLASRSTWFKPCTFACPFPLQ